MREDPFPFLRATFYRWAQRWPAHAGDLAREAEVPGVGDLHVENFGTWRDAEGRLAWGVNDFDEAWPLPWPFDLVRLAASAHLAAERGTLSSDPEAVADALLAGYGDALAAGGAPYVLGERHPALREMTVAQRPDPERFWAKLDALADADDVPDRLRGRLARSLPRGTAHVRFVHRVAGLGSLGRVRVVALGEWAGGRVAREAKAAAPSGCAWALGRPPRAGDARTREVADGAIRCPDPFFRARPRWIVRRLAPDSTRIELGALPKRRDERHLLHAMGWETANVHINRAGRRRAAALARAVGRAARAHGREWLARTEHAMREALAGDFAAWRAADGGDDVAPGGAAGGG